jgi:hypothetical protein
MLPGSALPAILSSRQSAHARVPAILEERAMPMITHIFPLLQTFPRTAFILFLLRLALETLLVLVFILFEEIGRSWALIPDMPYLLFHDISLFPFLGPIVSHPIYKNINRAIIYAPGSSHAYIQQIIKISQHMSRIT